MKGGVVVNRDCEFCHLRAFEDSCYKLGEALEGFTGESFCLSEEEDGVYLINVIMKHRQPSLVIKYCPICGSKMG